MTPAFTHATWSERIKFILLLLLQTLFGMAGVFACGFLTFREALRPMAERSIMLVILWAVLTIMFALIVPGGGKLIPIAGKKVLGLAQLGRQVYIDKDKVVVTTPTEETTIQGGETTVTEVTKP